MKRYSSFLRGFAFLAVLLAGVPAAAQFYYLETDDLRLVYYGKAHAFIAAHTARCFENSMHFHRQLFSYNPSEKTTVLLHDLGDYGNGGASTSPGNRVSLGIAPISYAYETIPANERVNATLNHELVHILAADNAAGNDRFFRAVLGGKVAVNSDYPLTALYNYLTLPRRSAPIWYHEGIAVFMETWMAGGLGRALGAYDEMVFRTMVRDSSRFYQIQGLESEGTHVDFHVGVNSYLYGTRFVTYLCYRFGPDKFVEWASREDGSRGYYAAQFTKVYGIELKEAWQDWIEWERAFQAQNLETIREYPVTAFRPVTSHGLGSVSQGHYDASENEFYCGVNYPGQVAYLAAIDVAGGDIRKICDIKGAALFFVTSLAYDSTSHTLFYTTDNNDWRDIVAVDARTGESRMLMKDARIGDLVFNYADSSLWGVRHFNGISALVRIPRPYREWNLVYAFPYGKDIYDISVSYDGETLAGSLSEISGRQTLICADIHRLVEGDSTFETLHDFRNTIPANFSFSPDGRYLYGASYYTGASNVFRYDLDADSMDAVTNCETGYFRPVVVSEDSLLVFAYTTSGFQPVMIGRTVLEDVNAITYLGQLTVEKHPVLKEWNVGSPARVNLDSMVVDSGQYHEWSHMGLVGGYPIVEGYKDYVAYGARFDFSGPLSLDRVDLAVSYSPHQILPEDERIHLKLSYQHVAWTLFFNYNGADFYDLFGPTKTSRKGFSTGVRWEKSMLYDPPRMMNLNLGLTHYGDLERLPEYQNIVSSYNHFLASTISLSYQNMRASLGAVDYEKGFAWSLSSSSRLVKEKFFPRVVGRLDFGFAMPVSHMSLWLRNTGGYAVGDRIEPLANFYFGGFGNNWVDHGNIKQFRHSDAFPGAELNEIAGTDFIKNMVEVNLPPIRFRKVGMPSFYVSWARPGLFATSLRTNLDDGDSRRQVFNLGAQVDFRLIMLSHLPFTLSAGYAAWFEHGSHQADEFMVSLKVL